MYSVSVTERQDANADPRVKTCPRCSRITEISAATLRRSAGAKHGGVLVECRDCALSWCFACQSPRHDGATCAGNRAGDELLKSWAQQTVRDVHNARRCPRCKVRSIGRVVALYAPGPILTCLQARACLEI